MKKRREYAERITCVILTAVLVLGTCSCGKRGEAAPERETAILDATMSDADTEHISENLFSDNVEAYLQEDWQRAYYKKLEEIRGYAWTYPDTMGYVESDSDSDRVYEYSLYDIDGDGIPELITHKGGYEADANTDVYTYREGKVILVGNMGAFHTSYYSCENENVMMAFNAVMNGISIYKISIADDTLSIDEVESKYVTDEETIDLDEYADNPQYLDSYAIALDLPLAEYGPDKPKQLSYKDERIDNALVQKRLTETVQNNGMLYGVSADGWGGNTGYVSFDEYCGPKMATNYNENPMEVINECFEDVDGNGQAELVLTLREIVSESEASSAQTAIVILSLQNDVVYAYSDHMGSYLGSGVFDDNYVGYRYSFYRDNCYSYRDREYSVAIWEHFPPTRTFANA